MYGECRGEVIEVVRTLLPNKRIAIVESAVYSDHIHLSVRIPPKYSVVELMGYLKVISALML